MTRHSEIADAALRKNIRRGEINLAGNVTLKIYGTLGCRQGKRMKRANRVFFFSKEEAIKEGYRPCGSCMIAAYREWKTRLLTG